MTDRVPGISYGVDMMVHVGRREPLPEGSIHAAGFCDACGIIREDVNGVPITDCVCTAKLKHKEGCTYLKAVGMWFSVGSCEAHGLDACEECDCDCDCRLRGAEERLPPT